MKHVLLRLVLIAVLAPVAAPNAVAGDELPVGVATITQDGVIVLQMSRTTDGIPADALIRYAPGDPDYDEVLEHLGGLAPGESKPVMPFPEEW